MGNLSLLYRGLNDNNVLVENLVNNRTYWWKVVARIYDIPYTYESPTWSFTIKIGFRPLHNIALSHEKKVININLGDIVYLNMTISNLGNVPEEVELGILGALKDYVSIPVLILIDPGETINVPFTIRAHESLSLNKYILTIKADFGDNEKTKRIDVQIGSVNENPDNSSSAIRYLTLIVVLVFLIGELIVFLFWIGRKRKKSKMDDIVPTPIYLSPYESPDLYALNSQSYTQQEEPETYGEVPSQLYLGEPMTNGEPASQSYSEPASYLEVPALPLSVPVQPQQAYMEVPALPPSVQVQPQQAYTEVPTLPPSVPVQPQQVSQVPMMPTSPTSQMPSQYEVPGQLMLAPAPEAVPSESMQEIPESQENIETPTAETVEKWMESLPGEYAPPQTQQVTPPEMDPGIMEMQDNIQGETNQAMGVEDDITEPMEVDSLSLEDDISALKDMISNVIRKDLPLLPPSSSDEGLEENNSEDYQNSGLQNIDEKLAMLDSLTEDYNRK